METFYMTGKLALNQDLIESCMAYSQSIARSVFDATSSRTTLSIERAILRLLGINGVNGDGVPLQNVVVEQVHKNKELGKGIAYWMGNAMIQTGKDVRSIAKMVAENRINISSLPLAPYELIKSTITKECRNTVLKYMDQRLERRDFIAGLKQNSEPRVYVLTATGNIYEDIVHAKAVVENGGDIVALIRSTAQSLLDYVPFGPTTEGYGGTYATQENFRIMRRSLDEWSQEHGRYIQLSSFSSGLCMPEIAAIGVMEELDNMVNDALYGILYRDINMIRTLIDQRFSRMLNGYFGVVINTGEDNYLRTADALQAAPSVTASQFINFSLARESGIPEKQIAVGGAFEIDPSTKNGLLYEWAQALLTRELFPKSPVKFMPPTKHMNGDPFRTHANDTLFNLVTVGTRQAIQTVGVPTEGIFTPHIHDRVIGLENARYVFNFAHDLADEIEFKPGGIVQTHAQKTLQRASEILAHISKVGLFQAIEEGTFGDISRKIDGGRGIDGIVATDKSYMNPYYEIMEEPK